MDQSELVEQIEKLFADTEPSNLRQMSRQLERLVRQLEDAALKRRYESAIDHLPDMIAHLDQRGRPT